MRVHSLDEGDGFFLEAAEVTHLTREEIRSADNVLQLALDQLRSTGATDLPSVGDVLGAVEIRYGVNQPDTHR
jgi:hypothetical protein